MTEHLSQNQIEDYCRRELSPTRLMSVSDHLAACEICRRMVEKALNGEAAFFALRSQLLDESSEALASARAAAHATFEQMADYVDGVLAGEELQTVQDHLSRCGECTLAVNDLRAFRDQIAPQVDRQYQPMPVHTPTEKWWQRALASSTFSFPKSPALTLASVLTILLLIVTGWVVWRTALEKETKPEIAGPTRSQTTPPTSTSPAPDLPPASFIAQIKDGPRQVTLDRDGEVTGIDNLPPAYKLLVKEALTSQRLERSPLLAGLNRPSSSLMGGNQRGNELSVIEPVGRVLLSERPTFRWSRLDGAASYVVEIYDEDFKRVAASPPVTTDSWTARQPLKRGGTYSWQVTVIKNDQEFKYPRPPAPQAKFRVLDEGKARELAEARLAYSSSHLIPALLYAQAGLLEEAEQELQALQKQNPGSTVVDRLLTSLQSMRR